MFNNNESKVQCWQSAKWPPNNQLVFIFMCSLEQVLEYCLFVCYFIIFPILYLSLVRSFRLYTEKRKSRKPKNTRTKTLYSMPAKTKSLLHTRPSVPGKQVWTLPIPDVLCRALAKLLSFNRASTCTNRRGMKIPYTCISDQTCIANWSFSWSGLMSGLWRHMWNRIGCETFLIWR